MSISRALASTLCFLLSSILAAAIVQAEETTPRLIQELLQQVPEGPNPLDGFGWAIAQDESMLVVTVSRDDDAGPSTGSALVFLRKGTDWRFASKLLPSADAFRITFERPHRFGESVVLGTDEIYVGSTAGVHIYSRGSIGKQRIIREIAGLPLAKRGVYSVPQLAFDSGTLAAFWGSTELSLFERPEAGWESAPPSSTEIPVSDLAGLTLQGIALSNGTLVVVGFRRNERWPDGGFLYSVNILVYDEPEQGWSAGLAEPARLRPFPVRSNYPVEGTVVTDGEHVFVGSGPGAKGPPEGSVHVYSKGDQGWTDGQLESGRLVGDASVGIHFGEAISVDEDRVAVLARRFHGRETSSVFVTDPAVFLYERPHGGWIGDVSATERFDVDPLDRDGYYVVDTGSIPTVSLRKHSLLLGEGSARNLGTVSQWDLGEEAGSRVRLPLREIGFPEIGGLVRDAERDDFGSRMASNGEILVITASGDDTLNDYAVGEDGGAAYVFVRSDTRDEKSDHRPKSRRGKRGKSGAARRDVPEKAKWRFAAKLIPDGYSFLTGPVDVAGPFVVLGASDEAVVFRKPPDGWKGIVRSSIRLKPSLNAGQFNDVAISRRAVVLTAPDACRAFVFLSRRGEFVSQEREDRVLMPDSHVEGDDCGEFGRSIALQRDTAVIGAPGRHFREPSRGAYVFEHITSGRSQILHESARLAPSRGLSDDGFGTSLDIRGRRIVVGSSARGYASVFERKRRRWTGDVPEVASLETDLRVDERGSSVAIGRRRIIVGLPGADFGNRPESGAVAIFDQPWKGWNGTYRSNRILRSEGLPPSTDGELIEHLGRSVMLIGREIFAGARERALLFDAGRYEPIEPEPYIED